jgi:hypothetical protein
LRRAPSLEEAIAMFRRVEQALEARGASVTARGSGTVRFLMCWPWSAPECRPLIAVTSGEAELSAEGGGPWRVRYRLNFTRLRVLCVLASLALIVAGRSWPRGTLLIALLVLWVVCYGAVIAAASWSFHQLIQGAAQGIVERRGSPRSSGEPGTAPPERR